MIKEVKAGELEEKKLKADRFAKPNFLAATCRRKRRVRTGKESQYPSSQIRSKSVEAVFHMSVERVASR